MSIPTLLLLVVLVASVLSAFFLYAPSYALLRNRPPDYSRWERLYSADQLETAMRALRVIASAFALRKDDIFRLEPTDQLLAIYHAAYPHGGADSLEFETLLGDLQKDVGSLAVPMPTLPTLTVADVITLYLSHASNAA